MVRKLQYLSQFDYTQVIKNVHDEPGNALRVSKANSEVPSGYSSVVFSRDANGGITGATYYRGTSAEVTRIVFNADVAGNLGGKSFLLNSPDDVNQFYVWYDTGSSIDPALPGKIGLRIQINPNDPASIVTLATKLLLDKLPDFFKVTLISPNSLDIENTDLGNATNSLDINTGFVISTMQEGATARIKTLTLEQDPNVKIVYNYGERQFELLPLNTSIHVQIPGLTVGSGVVQNIAAPVAGTEYSFVLPPSTTRFEFNCRGLAKLQFSLMAGQSGSLFKTVFPGNSFKEEGLVLVAPMTIYFQTTKANEIIELITWS